MMLFPEHKTHIEHSFDAFCKKVMRFEARGCYKEIERNGLREISLDYLIDELDFIPQNAGAYLSLMEMFADFNIQGHLITIQNKMLAFALHGLTEERRNLILLYYFLHVKAKDLAAMCGCSHSTINYRIAKTIKLLRKEMERIKHEEK